MPALVALTLTLLFVDPFIGDWDGLDYTVLALRGQPSSMALGRALFIYANHALYTLAHTLFGLRAENDYLLFKYAVVATSPPERSRVRSPPSRRRQKGGAGLD